MIKFLVIICILSLVTSTYAFSPYCSPKEKIPGPCKEIYQPVCAMVINKDGTRDRVDFSNRCFACQDISTLFIIEGQCDAIPKGAVICAPHIKDKKEVMCPDVYKPVCGYFNQNIQCLISPCAATFGNSCQACSNGDVAYYMEGSCEGDELKI